MKKINPGIRSKVMMASVVIGFMLFLSGLMAFFEFWRMNRYVSEMISNNISSVNASRNLLNACDAYHGVISYSISSDQTGEIPSRLSSGMFESGLDDIYSTFTTGKERVMADSVRYAYSAYMQVAMEIQDVWYQGMELRKNWYFDRLQTVYEKLRGYIQSLAVVSQNALTDNYDNLRDSYYRSIMPVIVSISAGILLIVLFNYFLNLFLITPVLKMNRGLREYREYGKAYDVTFDYGGDQIQEMNTLVKDITEEHKANQR